MEGGITSRRSRRAIPWIPGTLLTSPGGAGTSRRGVPWRPLRMAYLDPKMDPFWTPSGPFWTPLATTYYLLLGDTSVARGYHASCVHQEHTTSTSTGGDDRGSGYLDSRDLGISGSHDLRISASQDLRISGSGYLWISGSDHLRTWHDVIGWIRAMWSSA